MKTRYGKYGVWMPVAGLILTLLVQPAWAQESVPEFYVDAVASRGPGVSNYSRVDLYTRIPYAQLTFVNSPTGFSAQYTVTVEALAQEGDRLTSTPILTRIWDGRETTDVFAVTKDEGYSAFTTQALDLPPGAYQLSVEVEDKNSSRRYVRDLLLQVRNLNRPLAVSDITLLDSYDPATLSVKPRVSDFIGTDEVGVEIFFEVYSELGGNLVLCQEVVRANGEPGLKLASREKVYEKRDALSLAPGRSQHVANIPTEEFDVGTYRMVVRIEDAEGNTLDEVSRPIEARWNGLQHHIENVDDAITQLEYIAKKRDIDYMREPATRAERLARFREFWDKRDPTPDTRRNERMEEYYYRVSFANRRYGNVIDGWRTDRGFVMVRFGEPEFVTRKPHSFGIEPYEVWVYERIGRRFIFIDKSGFGDYQLLVPVWDERTRLY